MRMSDWSADVCSSDLGRSPGHCSECAGRRRERRDMSSSPPSQTPVAPPIVTADLTAPEQGMRARGAGDLTAAKEANVDGLLGITLAPCTGEGPAGEVILGGTPAGRLVCGFLFPRFAPAGG